MTYRTTRYSFTLLVAACFAAAILAAKKRVYSVDFEHIELTYYNPKYIADINVTARRYNRRDPTHYLSAHFELLEPLGKNVTANWYLYEFLSNEYRRSFVEAHFNLCDFVLNDALGVFVKEKVDVALRTCPFPKAVYHVENVSIPNLPLLSTFPFPKGRLYSNFTITQRGGAKEKLWNIHADTLIKMKFQ